MDCVTLHKIIKGFELSQTADMERLRSNPIQLGHDTNSHLSHKGRLFKTDAGAYLVVQYAKYANIDAFVCSHWDTCVKPHTGAIRKVRKTAKGVGLRQICMNDDWRGIIVLGARCKSDGLIANSVSPIDGRVAEKELVILAILDTA